MALLNPALFTALTKLYGSVRVLDGGVHGEYEKVYVARTHDNTTIEYPSYRLKHGGRRGEMYRLSCPFCGDAQGKGNRMYVSYLFGNRDERTGIRNMFNWVCYNESCQTDIENAKELLEEVSLLLELNVSVSDDLCTEVSEEDTVPIEELLENEVLQLRTIPGETRSLVDIDEDDRFSPVVNYLRDTRRFRIEKLDEYYGVRVITRSDGDRRLVGRVFTPFYRHGYRIGWNARSVPGFSENKADKYINSKGGLVGVCYGLNEACRHKVALLVEGVTDKWAVGDAAIAILGKKLNSTTLARLVYGLNNSAVKTLCVLLDPERSSDDVKHNRPHHIDVAVASIKKHWDGEVLPLFIPGVADPADLGLRLPPLLYSHLKGIGHEGIAETVARTVQMSTASW